MLCKRLIACLDVRAGRTVKGIRFGRLRDMGDPARMAGEYVRQGADEIVLLDVSATREERLATLETVSAVAGRLTIPLAVGGGIRRPEDAGRLLDAGADKVSVNTAAVRRPELLGEIADRWGSQCCVAAIDAAARGGVWTVLTHAGSRETGLEVREWARRAEGAGAGEILLTSRDRDGTASGFDLELTAAVSGAVGIPVIASGGAGCPEDVLEAFRRGRADAVLVAGMIHRGETTIGEIKRMLADSGMEVRTCWSPA